jgi:hypothetical protein
MTALQLINELGELFLSSFMTVPVANEQHLFCRGRANNVISETELIGLRLHGDWKDDQQRNEALVIYASPASRSHNRNN